MIDTVALELKIIELAMRGKLTHQNKSEQADIFFDEIVSLRDKYQKEGTVAKVKPMADIKEEEKVFSIPDNWKWVRLNEVLDVVMGQSPQGTSVSSDCEGMEFHQGKIYFTEKFLDDSKQRTCEITKIAKANSVLLCVRAPVGVVNIVEREICIGRGLCAISSYSDIDPLFVFYYLKICKKKFEMQGTGSTFSAITVDTVKKQLIPLPPKEEMKRIVDVLEKAFSISKSIENAQQQYSSDLEILKSKIIDAGIQGKLTEQLSEDGTADELLEQIAEEKKQLVKEKKIKATKALPEITEDEIPFVIPDNWKWVRFNDIANIIGTGMIRSGQEQYAEADYYYFKMNNIENFTGKCDFNNMTMVNASDEEFERYKLKDGDFLFNTRNSAELVGKTAVVHNLPSDRILLNNNILKALFWGDISSDYVNYFFIS